MATYVSVMSVPHTEAVPSCWHTSSSFCELARTLGAWHGSPRSVHHRESAVVKGKPSLYSICFAGVARVGQRCDLCLSLSHPTRECSDPDPDMSSRLKALEAAVLAFTAAGSAPPTSNRSRSGEICRSFNVGRCRMPGCRYRHVCRVCGGPLPAMSCCERQLGSRPGEFQFGPARQYGSNFTQPDVSQPVRRLGPAPPPGPPGVARPPRPRAGQAPY